jgi:hypothetical protein
MGDDMDACWEKRMNEITDLFKMWLMTSRTKVNEEDAVIVDGYKMADVNNRVEEYTEINRYRQ